MSKISKGNYYRLKTKKWLEKDGWTVENLEKTQRIFTKDKGVLFIKSDLWGADLIAVNGIDIIFVQCKTHKSDISKGIKELSRVPWPASVKRWVVRWDAGAREPTITVVNEIIPAGQD